MAAIPASTIHASAVLVGARAILIRGPEGSGKSRLALALIEAGTTGRLRFSRLVSDDRTYIEAAHGRLIARTPEKLAGLIEVRGLGIRRLPYEPVALVGLVVDLAAEKAERMPSATEREAEIAGIRLPRLAVAAGVDPLPLVLAARMTIPAGETAPPAAG
jgi:serine kinase of HPr protein (carbohydrate metabolism regulator)